METFEKRKVAKGDDGIVCKIDAIVLILAKSSFLLEFQK